ncbi:hypothetical protein ACFP63_19815 [Oerskovia jenensis]|uniref:MoeA N-terminal and linker domain-containing protein n=1 Tax=Oerskovia jenensis TaxID=162169 RepID=A0ABS2LLJ2_9CELL|nr:hypothetical protein [Oerskovia jenensis]MBM7480978.1 hypothetical protein [Oerskovia jenensis]
MTLTSILPTLRASIPDPLSKDSWPAATRATVTDVLVAGVSLAHLATLCGTPCVHVAQASGAGPVGGRMGTAVVAAVTDVRVLGPSGLELVLDAEIDPLQARWAQARLIGRASSVRPVRAVVPGSRGPGSLTVPADLHVGDLLAIPCRGQIALRDVRPAPGGSERVG